MKIKSTVKAVTNISFLLLIIRKIIGVFVVGGGVGCINQWNRNLDLPEVNDLVENLKGKHSEKKERKSIMAATW